ncbi:MAG: LysR family transcriptional regulator [Gemmatimonadetes bacterium]|nr:LysR family transcriptional regulator [Gemmatimonadota bacterium]MBK7350217.1 LysR family transcriptional regulator [Gemmatimonadota bacterium]MBK7716262.1 LysR family transcriptional regulator [Gemmatimonadota bacterium]MBK7923761.1 LysR family transcriptional regulator [Gemmatimonadota bacterium]MBK9069134.1 LysR family transcriptional regulator [Gemmatimonadota bacterium]
MITKLELRHLRYFVAVAEELHFGRAARRLGIAQPPLSQQIQRLEQVVGVRLFERTSRRVQLTDGGATLLVEARRVLAAATEAFEATRRAGRGELGELRVAFAATVMFLALPEVIREFRGRYPGVHLDLREMPTGPQLAGIKAGEIDIGFVREPRPDPELEIVTVMREPLRIAVNKSHPLAARPTIAVRHLAEEPFVLFPEELAPGLYAQVLGLCRAAGFTPRVVEESRELYTSVSLVEAGIGVSILPASVEKLGWRGVRYRPIPSASAETRIAAAWRKDRARPVVQAFMQVVGSVVGAEGGRPG